MPPHGPLQKRLDTGLTTIRIIVTQHHCNQSVINIPAIVITLQKIECGKRSSMESVLCDKTKTKQTLILDDHNHQEFKV